MENSKGSESQNEKPKVMQAIPSLKKIETLAEAERITNIKDFEIMNKIGKLVVDMTVAGDGAYSNVYKVKRKEDGNYYALKKVKLSHLSEKERENAINEVRILASVKHQNVIQYKEAFVDEESKSLW